MTSREREERWLRRGMALIGMLTIVLLVVTIVGMTLTLGNRQANAQRAADTLSQLESLADRLDDQAADMEVEASRTAEARRRFEIALQLLIDELGIDADPFPQQQTSAQSSSQPEPEPEPQPAPSDEPEPEPEPDEPEPDPSPSPSPDPVRDLLDAVTPDQVDPR